MTACRETTTTKENKKYQVIHPLVKDTSYEREYAATINSIMNVDIRNRIKGFIEEIYVDEGRKVVKGQLLFRLNSAEIEQLVRKADVMIQTAEAELRGVEIEYDNTKKLFDKNIVSKSELDLSATKVQLNEAKLRLARVEKEQAQLHLTFTEIRAPFSGVINRIPFKKGSLVDEGSLLTSISNNEFVYAYFNLSESEYLDYLQNRQKADRVQLILANNSLYQESGFIETTESEIDASTGNLAFRAKFNNNRNLLKQGSSGKILLPTHIKNAILIPQKSTFEIQGNIFLYIVDNQNKVSVKRISPLYRLSNFYVVINGISEKDQIILEGIQSLKEGDKIQTELISFPDFS
jgi:membrane fusion protein (multidrug efflux system)